jgi:hypothetical protein
MRTATIFHTWSKQTMNEVEEIKLSLDIEKEKKKTDSFLQQLDKAVAEASCSLKYDMDTGRMIEVTLEEL